MFQNCLHSEIEPKIVQYWEINDTLNKLRKKNEKGPKFYFLDGPPYTSGKFHLAHAWNYALKDMVLRYKRSQGFHLWDRNGFDMHGLPTEHKVVEKFALKTKEEIQKFGVDKFVTECEKFCRESAKNMTNDLIRWGITFDVSNPYMPITSEFIEGEWQLIKKSYDKELLYFGEKVITWCQHCETAIAKHECEYENVKEDSIFLKFQIKGKKNEYLIAWTTTPWTIPYNLAIMVNPELEYVKVDVGSGEKWILAKALAGVVVQAVAGRKMKILEEFKGDKLEGTEYLHPLEKHISKYAELKKKHKNVHTVILSEQYVDTSAGSGLVHCAPGCGPEDQEAAKPYKIPPFNSLTEQGFFPEGMGKFSGWRAKVNDAKFIQALKDEGCIISVTEVEHEYPFCWRCHKPVVFRLTQQWFLKTEAIKEKILKGNKKVHWVPETANNSYEAWVRNLKDNSVSRQRFWGTPLPIWKCQKCKGPEGIKVIGSRAEIEKNGGKVPENLHIPWIDSVELKCSCGGTMKRVPDIIDVWVDAGTTSWNCLNNDSQLIKEWYPADAILEAKEQTRLWFSMLSICSYIQYGNNAFKNVYVHGMLNDLEGKKMSKSLGNIVSSYELIDKHGVDVLRYYMGQNNAGEEINFSWEECANKARNLQILWNVHKFLLNLARENKANPFLSKKEIMHNLMTGEGGLEERYIFSKLNSTIKKVTELYEAYRLDEAIAPLEAFYLELSRTYIQMVRDKSALGEEQEKELVMYTLAMALHKFLRMFSIVCPFISEAIYLNLKEEFHLKEESISHYSWPAYEEKWINQELEQQVALSLEIIQGLLNAREKAKLGVRWPLKEVIIATSSKEASKAAEKLAGIIKTQVNAKELKVLEKLPKLKIVVRPNGGKIGPAYGSLSGAIIARLTIDSPETIMGHIEKESAYRFTLEGQEVKITRDMLLIEHEVPAPYVEAGFGEGLVYINTERTLELDAEGYAREIMRNVQQLRKQAGLEKRDRIALYLFTSLEMQKSLKPLQLSIEEKIGAEKMEFGKPTKSGLQQSEFSVKQEKFLAWLEKV